MSVLRRTTWLLVFTCRLGVTRSQIGPMLGGTEAITMPKPMRRPISRKMQGCSMIRIEHNTLVRVGMKLENGRDLIQSSQVLAVRKTGLKSEHGSQEVKK